MSEDEEEWIYDKLEGTFSARPTYPDYYNYDNDDYDYYGSSYGYSSDCLIATAAYGSKIAPAVVFLRSFRDKEVMKTKIGKAFMRLFNAVYYQFSPKVAQWMRKHALGRSLIRRIIVMPLVYLLRFSELFTRPIKNKELRVIVVGVVFTSISFFIIKCVLDFFSYFGGLIN